MASRPGLADARSRSQDASRGGQHSPFRVPQSPRVAHIDGEIPPQLSPLDAFAAQGRLLAKQLDDSQKNGRRLSRLPPLTIASSLAQARPGYFRSKSADSERDITFSPAITPSSSEDQISSANITEVSQPSFRPESYYPRLSSLPSADEIPVPQVPAAWSEQKKQQDRELESSWNGDVFSPTNPQLPETRFPDPTTSKFENRWPFERNNKDEELLSPGRDASFDLPSSGSESRNNTNPQHPSKDQAYQPYRPTSSIRSVPPDSSDDDYSTTLEPPSFPMHRRVSANSSLYGSQGPLSPAFPHAAPRSPSLSSEYSTSSNRVPRMTFNFSRPLSRASQPSFDLAYSQSNSESQAPPQQDDSIHTPVSMNSDEYGENAQDLVGPAPSYTYSRFSLPRGRMVSRNSSIFLDQQVQLQQHQFSWDQPLSYSNVVPTSRNIGRPPSPPSPPRPLTNDRPSLDLPRPGASHDLPLHRQHRHTASAGNHPSSAGSIASSDTITGRSITTPTPNPPPSEMTAEDHLSKGIDLHEHGSLNESTYHLRIAAKQGLPTAMLFYALACRHGWGMRPNAREGVQWLRKAMDSTSLDLADDESLVRDGNAGDIVERKARKAQFALSIYELGVSHLNGWGIEQDKALALRCFEIAGAWGDADALAEAGFCYAEGIGCKKDLKKSAKFYRAAESKGMSMVGNSWIYKAKYMDDDNDNRGRSKKSDSSEKKPRDKSRTRTLFGKKKLAAGNS